MSALAEHVRLDVIRVRAERACQRADRIGSWIAAREADGWILRKSAYMEFERAYRKAETAMLEYQLALGVADDPARETLGKAEKES